MICAVSLLLVSQTQQVTPPFWKEVQAFKKQDSEKPPKKGHILFIGSSSFTNWKDVNDYFPGKGILNRAFGGSTLNDLIRYSDDLLIPYEPRQIVIYCGENDLASSEKPSAYTVYHRFERFMQLLRQKHPKLPVAYVCMKPSWSRWHLRGKYIAANQWIKDFEKRDKQFKFINVWDAMLDANGRPIQEIFIGDELHMNAKGYKIWQPIMEPFLK